jgi:hypothetical protein
MPCTTYSSRSSAAPQIEFIVYYSGHADESGILVGSAHYDYARLRQRIRDVPASTSCTAIVTFDIS